MKTKYKMIFLAVLCTASSTIQAQESAEVVVYGGTSAGVMTAVAVARQGKSVVVLEPGKHLGGLASGGLGATDVGNSAAIGGYSREFFDRVRDHYVQKYGKDSQQVKDCNNGFRFEPHVAEGVFEDLVREHKILVHRQVRLESLTKKDRRITSITVSDPTGKQFSIVGKIFVDAGYEGDLMAKAKVTYRVGREDRKEYGESLAGVQEYSKFHQFSVKVPPFLDGGNRLPLIQPGKIEPAGTGDSKVQAYNFRMCMTQRTDLKLPWTKPKAYDPARYELAARYVQLKPDVRVPQLMNPVKVPNGKTDTNNNGPVSTDHIGANWDYPDADYATRKKIWDDHVDYQKGLMYFFAHDPRVPEKLRQEMNSWGLSKGEFVDNDHWPHQLYIREARRMVGEYVMTQHDIMVDRVKADSVGLGSYNADSHHVQRVVSAEGFALNEGDFQVGVKPYAIPYRSLVPKIGECENLIVPVCLSSSHVSYGTIRMEPVFMLLGQASGAAATLALAADVPVQKISTEKLVTILKEQKAVLSPEGLAGPGAKAGIPVKSLPGIVVDDTKAKVVGTWTSSFANPPYVGDHYLHDGNEDPGKKSVRFTPMLEKAGKYEVRLFYPSNMNRASNVLVVVHHAEGEAKIRVNQKKPADSKGHRLGEFRFDVGSAGWVEIRNDEANGYVIADAVQWLPK